MKEKRKQNRLRYDETFKLSLLVKYYEGSLSQNAFCKSHEVDVTTFIHWRRKYEEEIVSLPSDISELEKQVYQMARKKKELRLSSESKTIEEQLREENERLRKALAYSELRNEALNELIKIGKDQYGFDLLKKAGAKQ